MAPGFACIKKTCRSPVACEGFGYCRERNFDGAGMDESQVQRRGRESDSETLIAARAE
ncbi:hypothetical protein LJR220_003386 [Bradyrhizobium sp. LjRoot220]|uniref:hypothetical protein n=1 Tax=Bradyrhizobium sp. LjRoot220 TaxID=3342284 RepID=UPI003ECC5A63